MWTASARHHYRRSGGRYATDVTDAEFARIEPLLPAAKRGGRRRKTLLREVLNALLYLLRTGCPPSRPAGRARFADRIGRLLTADGGCCRANFRPRARSTATFVGSGRTASGPASR
jgi:hypothetical protein